MRVLSPAFPTAQKPPRCGISAMPDNPSSPLPGLGVLATRQRVPFQRSASVLRNESESWPTAQARRAETTATPNRMFDVFPGFRLRTTFHAAPFQCSMSVLRNESGSAAVDRPPRHRWPCGRPPPSGSSRPIPRSGWGRSSSRGHPELADESGMNGHGGAQIGHISPALGTKVLLPQVGCRGRLGTV
jgi:hypothetical protein